MICVGIDVAKDKHDCFILSSEGEVLADVFTIPNNAEGFDTLLQTIRRCTCPTDKIKVGLEATGHYSYNILGFLLNKGLATYVINPLHTNLYRKSLSLRKTKTDRVDARTIATMLMSDVDLKSYTDTAYHNEELKSLTRYRFDMMLLLSERNSSVELTVCFSAVGGAGDHGEVEHRAVHLQNPHGHVGHIGGNKNQSTLGQQMLFSIDGHFDFCMKIIGILRIAAEEADELIGIVGVSFKDRIPFRHTVIPCGIHLERTGDNFAVDPENALGKLLVHFLKFRGSGVGVTQLLNDIVTVFTLTCF